MNKGIFLVMGLSLNLSLAAGHLDINQLVLLGIVYEQYNNNNAGALPNRPHLPNDTHAQRVQMRKKFETLKRNQPERLYRRTH